MSIRHVYADESKRGRYLLVAVTIEDPDVARKAITSLILPGQRRLHMVRERDSRRRLILSTLVQLGLEAVIYDAGRDYREDREARGACLTALATDLLGRGDTRLVIEEDESELHADRLALYQATYGTRSAAGLTYVHDRASHDQLLAIPDAIAWSWPQGGDWRRRVGPLVTAVRDVGNRR